MFGGFLHARGEPGDNARQQIRFWWAITWINAVNLVLTFVFAFAIVAAAAIAWRRYS